VTTGTEAPRSRTPEPGRTRQLPTRAQRDARAGRLLLSPTLVVVLVVVVVPIAWSIALAFQDLRLINLRRRGLVGPLTLDNIADVFTSSGFWESLGTTLLFSVVGTLGSIGVGLVAALALRRPFRGRTVVRASMLLPYVAPVVAVTFVWQTMLNPQFGIVNHVGRDWFGWDDPVAFLSQRSADVSLFGLHVTVPVALLSVMAFETWRYFPFAFLFLTARLQAVPGELEEAARVDGATPTQRFRHILLPQLAPVIALLAVLRFIFTFNEFDDIFLLTGGAAGTEVVSVRVYSLLTARGNIGGAAAQALVLALVLVAFLLVYFRFFARRAEEA
jgi:multiple sugar transport system permease protein